VIVCSISRVETKEVAHTFMQSRSIPSSTRLIEQFLRCWGPTTQNLQDTFQELKDALYREGFPVDDETIVKECEIEKQHHPPSANKVLEENDRGHLSDEECTNLSFKGLLFTRR
jgi:hypothetical protein